MGGRPPVRLRSFVVVVALVGVAVGGFAVFLVVSTLTSLCPGVLCEPPVPGLNVVNDSGRVVIVQPTSGPSRPDLEAAFVDTGRGVLFLAARGSDNCEPVRLHAVDLDGNELGSLSNPCVGDTWTIQSDPRPATVHQSPDPFPSDQTETRILVAIDQNPATAQWLGSVQERVRKLDARLRARQSGSAQGPYEEEYAVVFFVYSSDPSLALGLARSVLLGSSGPTTAYADTSQPGQHATPTGSRTNLVHA